MNKDRGKAAKSSPRILEQATKKRIRFSDDVEKIEFWDEKSNHEEHVFEFDASSKNEDIFQSMNADDAESSSDGSVGLADYDDYDDDFDFLDNGDIDRKLLRNLNRSYCQRESKDRLFLANFEEGDIDSSVKHFVNEMSDFYNEMSSKLKSLKDCPVLNNSASRPLEPDDEKFMIEENFKNLYKNLKTTPQMKKTLSMISKMDSDISETITKFRKERAERLDIQKHLIRNIPVDRDSKLFLQLCKFEASSNENQQKIDSNETRKGKNENKRRNSRTMEDKNFVERNIELAKMGMNFPLSDEQKQRLERLLKDNDGSTPQTQSSDTEATTELSTSNLEEDIFRDCTLNAYRMSDDHKGRLIEIDSALQAFDEEQPRQLSESSIGVDLVRSLKEIDEKLQAISTSYIHNEELLEKNRKRVADVNTDQVEVDIFRNVENKSFSQMSTRKDL